MIRNLKEVIGAKRFFSRLLPRWGQARRKADYPPGYLAAKRVLEAGRGAFFGLPGFDLPVRTSAILAADDLVPQFGYVGAEFHQLRVLLLGINPGNGAENATVRNMADENVIPALKRFADLRTPQSFIDAQNAYKDTCRSWPMWGRNCADLLKKAGLSIEQVAYSNCLPWRTASQTSFNDLIAQRAARLYAIPLIEELKPNIIVAVGKKAATILADAHIVLPPVVVWNRARVATEYVEMERQAATARLCALLDAVKRDQTV